MTSGSGSPPTPPPSKDVRLLRAVLARELETINEYETMAEEAEDPHIREFFLHLAKEEKEHVGEAMALINERDADQKRELDEADTRFEHFTGAAGARGAPPPAGAGSAVGPPRLTVGSLRGRPPD